MLEAKPGAFARLGQGGADGGCFLHNSTYDFNDAVIPARRRLSRRTGRGGDAAREDSSQRSRRPRALRDDDPDRRICRHLRARRAKPFSRPPALAASRSHATCIRSCAGAEGEELSIDVAVLGPADARDVLLLTSGTHGAEGFCGSGCQVNLLRDDAFVAEAIERRRARRLPARAQSVRLLAPAPHQRGQRRPQPQFPRLLARCRRPTPPTRRSTASWCRRPGRRRPRTKRVSRAYVAGARRARAAGGGDRRPVRVSRRPLLRRRASRVEQPRPARGAARSTPRGRRTLGWIDFHTGLGPRGHGEKIYAGRDDRRRRRARQGVVGRRTSRRSTTARRRRRR